MTSVQSRSQPTPHVGDFVRYRGMLGASGIIPEDGYASYDDPPPSNTESASSSSVSESASASITPQASGEQAAQGSDKASHAQPELHLIALHPSNDDSVEQPAVSRHAIAGGTTNCLQPPPPQTRARPMRSMLSASDSIPMMGHIANQKLTVRVLVDAQSSGRLLGRGGITVKRMRQESLAWIDIASLVRGATRRVVTVKGTVQQVVSALVMIAEQLTRPAEAPNFSPSPHSSISASDSIVGLGASLARGSGNSPSAERGGDSLALPTQTSPVGRGSSVTVSPVVPIGNSALQVQITLLVHNQQVGCIIGKGGITVRETREQSGATINVSEHMLETSSEKTVMVKGTVPSVRNALQILVQQLFDRQDRASSHNLYVPHPPLEGTGGMDSLAAPFVDPAAAAAIYAAAAQVQQAASLPIPIPLSGPAAAAAYSAALNAVFANAGQTAPPAAPPQNAATALHSALASLHGQYASPAPSPQQTIMVPVPEHMIGCVIGKRGSTIRDIRLRSRAQVTVAESNVSGADRLVTITGSRPQTEVAVAMVYEKINSFQSNGLPSRGGTNSRTRTPSLPGSAPGSARNSFSGGVVVNRGYG